MSVEVGKSQTAGFVDLAEDDLLFRPVHGTPRPHPAFQGAANAATQLRMAPPHLLEDGDRSQCRRRLQHRQDLGLEKLTERVGSTPRAW